MLDVIIDMDNTLIDTVGAITQINNERHNESMNPENVLSYGFQELSLTDEEKTEIFASKELWEHMKWYPEAIKMVRYLKNKFHVVLSTRGSAENIKHKIDFIRKEFSDIGIVPVVIKDSPELSLDKDMIKTKVLVDDNPKVLKFVREKTYPICLRVRNWNWNKDYNGITADSYYALIKKVEYLISEYDKTELEVANYELYDGMLF